MNCAPESTLTTQSCGDTYPDCVGICDNGWCYNAQSICACTTIIDDTYCSDICNQLGYLHERVVNSPFDCFPSENYMNGCCCS
jgi:hypothetical protein